MLTASNVIPPGITSEPLLFIIVVLFVIFGANGIVGIIQKINDYRKNKSETSLDRQKLDFEIDKFSIETVQQAVITLNGDMVRIRSDHAIDRNELVRVRTEFSELRLANVQLQLKNAALVRYIDKVARQSDKKLPSVDTIDITLIPEVTQIVHDTQVQGEK